VVVDDTMEINKIQRGGRGKKNGNEKALGRAVEKRARPRSEERNERKAKI